MKFLQRMYRFLHPRYQTLYLEYKVNFKPRNSKGNPHKLLFDIIDLNRNQYKVFLEKALDYQKEIFQLKDSKDESDSLSPTWNNGYLPGLDIITLYTLVSEVNPRKYIEIGSGNSTKVVHKAKVDQNLRTEIISIDPQPRAEIDAISNKIIREPFESIKFDILSELKENDILFMDNSHRIMPNSDALVFFLEILPFLKKGVIVHVHDVYLPYDYPQFMCDRFYSEQYGLAFYLIANPEKYSTLLPNYFISEDAELSGILSSYWNDPRLENVESHGGSFWFKIAK